MLGLLVWLEVLGRALASTFLAVKSSGVRREAAVAPSTHQLLVRPARLERALAAVVVVVVRLIMASTLALGVRAAKGKSGSLRGRPDDAAISLATFLNGFL